MRTRPVPGEFYRHFKNKMYQIIAIAYHSETQEEMVVYQALYGAYQIWVRPLSMFMEEVDHEKYPEVKQKFRFEKVMQPEDVNAAENEAEEAALTERQERPMNRHLLDFFDAMDDRNYDKMLEALAKLSGQASQKEIDDICMVFDIHTVGVSVYEQIAEIKRHILTLKKFDGERLR